MMPPILRGFWLFLCISTLGEAGNAQCNSFFSAPLSNRPANYDIYVTLDDRSKMLNARQSVRFVNQSPVPIPSLRFYLYLNAFKNTGSTFLKGASHIFGQGFTDRKPEEWGWVSVDRFTRDNGADLSGRMRYVQPDDGNPEDASVLEVMLDRPLMPGESAVFQLDWRARVPKTIARAGYSKDFYLFCHWFPQLGVFQKDTAGQWGWNCHQFFRNTEFYADFGVYDVHITADKRFVLGASGCLISEKDNADGTNTWHYHAEDVIDFAWSIYPHFTVQEEHWRGVQIRLLISPEHAALGPRYRYALKSALEYLDQHVGKYPYPTITVVDPPFHGLRSGLMEYPTLITVGTFYGMPRGIRTMESLVVHEFVHQYFMGMVASNEKEEAWLDEGFVTYFEDRIIDATFGPKRALIDFFGCHFDNREQTRIEYTTMANPREGIVARPGWMFSESNFKALIYSKPATTLHTLQAFLGEADMDKLLQTYFEKWKFKHPIGRDFMQVLQEVLPTLTDTVQARKLYQLVETSIYDARVLDYAVTAVSNELLPPAQGIYGKEDYRDGSGAATLVSKVEVQRKGDWVFPVEIQVLFEDGRTELVNWSGVEGKAVFEFAGRGKIVSAQIDPQHKIGLDIDLNNNSLVLEPEQTAPWKYAFKTMFWIQNLFQTLSFLV